ncbi:MAG: FAD:protein FMN transferase [Myxococcota bacterium]|nr:hypothetical protein [Myxococcales bacterium]MEC7750680.1 FAD:protein FMN transferase [Myxococcota bacterium]
MRSLMTLSLLAFTACASAPEKVVSTKGPIERTILINGATLEIKINEPDLPPWEMTKLMKAVGDQARSVDNTFFDTGVLELLNDELKKGKGPVKLHPLTGKMLADAVRGYQLSAGIFDPTVGPLISAWREEGWSQPPPSALRAALTRVGADKLQISEDRTELRTTVPGMRLEPRGMRDGWVVSRVKELLDKRRINNYYINFNGACYYGAGTAPGGKPWPVMVRDHHSKPVAQIFLSDQSLSLSVSLVPRPDGRPGKKGHIYDPRDGFMVSTPRSVAAVAPSPLDAEILSTSSVVLGENADVVSMKIAESGIVIYQGKAAAPLRIGEPVDLRPMKRFDDDF